MRSKRPTAGLAALVMLFGVAAAAPNLPARGNVGCEQGQVQPTTLSIEGNLYAVVRGEHNRYAFGGRGPYVLSFQEALVLVRLWRSPPWRSTVTTSALPIPRRLGSSLRYDVNTSFVPFGDHFGSSSAHRS